MACPICVASEGSTIADGARAGAVVLIVVAAVVVMPMVRFAWRLWVRREMRA